MDELKALEYLRQKPLKDLENVARSTKIPRATLIKIKYGTTKFPRYPALRKIVVWALRDKKAA